jgi:hypothetical protein
VGTCPVPEGRRSPGAGRVFVVTLTEDKRIGQHPNVGLQDPRANVD